MGYSNDIGVCFQGTVGSYSEQALLEYFGDKVMTHPVMEFEDVFKELKSEKFDYGVLPIENSSTGAITEVYDLLKKYGMYIVGNKILKISHNLMGIKGTRIEDIRKVYSHTQALRQCSEFLKQNDWELIAYHNTAISAELVREQNSHSIAAIGSKKAAEVNNLEIIKENINNNDTNYTRFIIISREMIAYEENDVISIVFSNPDKVGTLYESLRIFKEYNLNMIRIESRPVIGMPWEYFFYIDFEGHIHNEEVRNAIDYMNSNCSYFKILGTYKKG